MINAKDHHVVAAALTAEATCPEGVARRADELPNDPVLVLIDDGEPTMTFDEWLTSLTLDEPTDFDAGAAEILREIREHGER